MKNISISSENEETNDSFLIFACTRPITNKQNGLPEVEHCFIKLVQNEKVIDSRGFFGDVGSVQEPSRYVHEGNCKMVKEISDISEWYRILEYYQKNKTEDYNLTSKNCCTVAKEALEASGFTIPKNIKNANCSVGTQSKFDNNNCNIS